MILQDVVPRTTIQHHIYAFLKDEEFNNQQPLGTALRDDWRDDHDQRPLHFSILSAA